METLVLILLVAVGVVLVGTRLARALKSMAAEASSGGGCGGGCTGCGPARSEGPTSFDV